MKIGQRGDVPWVCCAILQVCIAGLSVVAQSRSRSTGVPAPAHGRSLGSQQLLSVNGSELLVNGSRLQLRGVNLYDVHNCGYCVSPTQDFVVTPAMTAAVTHQMDVAVLEWGANFIRLLLSGLYDPTQPNTARWPNLRQMHPTYYTSVQTIGKHAGSYNKTVILMVSILWDFEASDYALKDGQPRGLPNNNTLAIWQTLTPLFEGMNHVMFGVVNEPHDVGNLTTAASRFEIVVKAIRQQEVGLRHVISVQGLNKYGRSLSFWVSNPIADPLVVYETHWPGNDIEENVRGPWLQGLPVIVGEIGPCVTNRTVVDDQNSLETVVKSLRELEALRVPYAVWAFGHADCIPSLLINKGDCWNSSTVFTPSRWGAALKTFF